MKFSTFVFTSGSALLAGLIPFALFPLIVAGLGAESGQALAAMRDFYQASTLLQIVAFGYCLLGAWMATEDIPERFKNTQTYFPSLDGTYFWMQSTRLRAVLGRTLAGGVLAIAARFSLPGSLFTLPDDLLSACLALCAYGLFLTMVGVACYALVRQLRTYLRIRQYDAAREYLT